MALLFLLVPLAESSRPRELPPQPLTHTDVNLSVHPAPIVYPTHRRNASEQIMLVVD